MLGPVLSVMQLCCYCTITYCIAVCWCTVCPWGRHSRDTKDLRAKNPCPVFIVIPALNFLIYRFCLLLCLVSFLFLFSLILRDTGRKQHISKTVTPNWWMHHNGTKQVDLLILRHHAVLALCILLASSMGFCIWSALVSDFLVRDSASQGDAPYG